MKNTRCIIQKSSILFSCFVTRCFCVSDEPHHPQCLPEAEGQGQEEPPQATTEEVQGEESREEGVARHLYKNLMQINTSKKKDFCFPHTQCLLVLLYF